MLIMTGSGSALNLITNANEATDHGNIIIRSYQQIMLSEADLLGHKAQSFSIIIEIEDSGCGIKEENINLFLTHSLQRVLRGPGSVFL